jgi:hypothetical protein
LGARSAHLSKPGPGDRRTASRYSESAALASHCQVSVGLAQRYEVVLALRPDAVLSAPLRIPDVCAAPSTPLGSAPWVPGLRIIHGFDAVEATGPRSGATQTRSAADASHASHASHARHQALATCEAISSSTWDLGVFACDPRALTRWLYPVWERSVGCDASREFAQYGLSPRIVGKEAACAEERGKKVPDLDRTSPSLEFPICPHHPWPWSLFGRLLRHGARARVAADARRRCLSRTIARCASSSAARTPTLTGTTSARSTSGGCSSCPLSTVPTRAGRGGPGRAIA